MIKGVIVKKLGENIDERGWLIEIYRKDFDQFQAVMSYASRTKFKAIRGPHEHKEQSDFFIFIGPGNFELHLWDNRKDSKTFGKKMKMIVGESNKVSVLVPPGIVHGYKAISKNGSLCTNLPDKLYAGEGKKEEVDEIRHENNLNSKFIIP
jgi:dTDP-4-dehydrorhamnose 3,5-epimerase